MSTTSAGDRLSAKAVKPLRSAWRTEISRSTPPSEASEGSDTRARGDVGRQVRAEQPVQLSVEAAVVVQRVRGLGQQPPLPVGELEALDHVLHRVPDLIIGGVEAIEGLEGIDEVLQGSAVVASDAFERRVEREAVEETCPAGLTLELGPQGPGDGDEGGRHQEVPLPPGGLPRTADRRDGEGVAEEDEGDRDGGQHADPDPSPVQREEPQGGEREQQAPGGAEARARGRSALSRPVGRRGTRSP